MRCVGFAGASPSTTGCGAGSGTDAGTMRARWPLGCGVGGSVGGTRAVFAVPVVGVGVEGRGGFFVGVGRAARGFCVGGSVGGTSARGGSGGGGAVRAFACGAVTWPLSPLNPTLVPTRVGSPITAIGAPVVVTDT